MKLKVTVTSKSGTYELVCLIHASKNARYRKLNKEFYLAEGRNKRVPKGFHHEIEIIAPDPGDFPNFKKLHIHYSKKNNPFVCIIWPMPTIEYAFKILEMWAAGTVYSIITGQGFMGLFTYQEAGNEDFARVLELLKNEYSIVATIETIE